MSSVQLKYDPEDTELLASLREASEAGRSFYCLAKHTVASSRLKRPLAELEHLHTRILNLCYNSLRYNHCGDRSNNLIRISYRHAELVIRASNETLITTLLELETRQKHEQLRVLAKLRSRELQHALSAQIAWLQMIIDKLITYKSMHTV